MRIDQILEEARESLTVRRVFGDPYDKNGITFIPVARIAGGGGGGSGNEEGREGSGGGFGLSAHPVGAYQIRGDEVTWVPAVDLTKVIVIGQVVAVVALLVLRSILRRRARH